MLVYTSYRPRQSLYEDLSIPLTTPFSSTSPGQNLQPLAMKHPNYNPLKPSRIFPAITYPAPLKLEPQARSQNEPSPKKKDKEPSTSRSNHQCFFKTSKHEHVGYGS